MTDLTNNTIAQILYTAPPAPNFARLVSGIGQALDRFRAQARQLDWNEDDLAIFDMDHCRIALHLSENPGQGHACCLSVAVGPSARPRDEDDGPFVPQHLCSALVERIAGEIPCDAVIWTEAPGIISGERLEALLETLPSRREIEQLVRAMDAEDEDEIEVTAAPAASQPAPVAAVPVLLATAPAEIAPATDPVVAAEEAPLPMAEIIPIRHFDPELQRLRAALYAAPESGQKVGAKEDRELSVQMRLAVHSLNATLIVVMLPVGAALTTYTLLRGKEDMRLTGRAMALAGFALMLAQSIGFDRLVG